MTVRFPTAGLVFAGALVLAASANRAAAEDVVEMRFEGFGPAGVHLMTTHTVIEETPAWYLIQGDFATAGLGALFVSVSNRSMAEGRQTGEVPKPERFDSETARNGVVQHNRVDYRADGTPNGSSLPPPAEPVTPLDARLLAGTVDNLTAYLLLERRIARGGNCALRVPVFDGRHRYDLRFSDGGAAELKPAAGQNYAGPAHQCLMVRDEIGGFFVDRGHQEGASAGTIWYANLLPGDIAIPVRMKMDTEIGEVAIYLSELRARGVDWRFME